MAEYKMKKIVGKGEPFEPGDNIRLTADDFWRFNQGASDRFQLFIAEENERLARLEERFDSKTAYNYHRLAPEFEENEWQFFYRDLRDELFKKYDYILVTRHSQIYGVKGNISTLIARREGAYEAARDIISGD